MTRRRLRERQLSSPICLLSLGLIGITRLSGGDAFHMVAFVRKTTALPRVLFSSVGGNDERPPDDGNKKNNDWDDFLNPDESESDNLRKAREYMAENSLPISFGSKNNTPESATFEEELEDVKDLEDDRSDSSALVANNDPNDFTGGLAPSALARNPYMAVVSKLSPSDLISKFTTTAHPRVQNAVRSTILGLIGGLPKMAFDTTTITTGQKLASLMFQLQMTGYMFKNADYRLSMQQSLGVSDDNHSLDDHQLLLSGDFSDGQDQAIDALAGKVKGKLRVKYGKASTTKGSSDDDNDAEDEASPGGLEMEVDAAAYMSELRSEVSKLRDELMSSQKETEETMRKDLLMYIRTLPQQELQSLTNTMSPDVLVAMKGLVNAVMSGIGEGQISADTVTEQSGEAMAQLCMWQLVIGYNLRTLEVREEMRKSLNGSVDPSDDIIGAVEPGTLE